MSWDPRDDEPLITDTRSRYRNSASVCPCDNCCAPESEEESPKAEWIVYGETGAVIATFGQDELRARECALACGGKDRGIALFYKETSQ